MYKNSLYKRKAEMIHYHPQKYDPDPYLAQKQDYRNVGASKTLNKYTNLVISYQYLNKYTSWLQF